LLFWKTQLPLHAKAAIDSACLLGLGSVGTSDNGSRLGRRLLVCRGHGCCSRPSLHTSLMATDQQRERQGWSTTCMGAQRELRCILWKFCVHSVISNLVPRPCQWLTTLACTLHNLQASGAEILCSQKTDLTWSFQCQCHFQNFARCQRQGRFDSSVRQFVFSGISD